MYGVLLNDGEKKARHWPSRVAVGLLQDSYLILDTLPAEYDSRVKAMEVDEKPTEDYSDIGGLDKQIQELVEAIVLPVTHKVSMRPGDDPTPLQSHPPRTERTLCVCIHCRLPCPSGLSTITDQLYKLACHNWCHSTDIA